MRGGEIRGDSGRYLKEAEKGFLSGCIFSSKEGE